MSEELARVEPREITVSDMEKMAEVFASSKLFGIENKDQAMALMLVAQAEGLHPATIARDYHIIKGQPSIKAQAALSRFQASGGTIEWSERSDKIAKAMLSHPAGGDLEVTWTLERAKQAGLLGNPNWQKYPAQMLSARVVAEGVRALYPACLNSFYLVEEVQDFEDKPSRKPATKKQEEEFKPVQVVPEQRSARMSFMVTAASYGKDTSTPTAARELLASLDPEYRSEAKAIPGKDDPEWNRLGEILKGRQEAITVN